jgi:hypothetical protein
VICSTGNRKSNQTRKNRLILRGAVGVWNCESSDRIKGCDGACIHAVGFLAGAGGWSITNVAAFTFSKSRKRDSPSCRLSTLRQRLEDRDDLDFTGPSEPKPLGVCNRVSGT